MKTICFFSGDITRCGGTERVSTRIANELVQTGKYRVLFLSIVEQNNSPFFNLSSEIKRYVLRKDKRWIRFIPSYLPLIPVLRFFLKKHAIDIIIDVDIVLDILSVPAAVGMAVKVISWEHFHYYFEQKFLYRRMIARFSVLFSDYMITLTKQDRDNYVKKMHRKAINYIYNPMETVNNVGCFEDDSNTSKECMLITIGSLNKRKGTDLIARIVPVILRRYVDWKWIFLGDGKDRAILEEIICRYHLDKRLILAGNVSNVGDYLRHASICVMTSRLEGLPMCLLEAKAYRVPCVAFDIQTGPSEIIQNEVNGFLVQPFDLNLMVQKIALLIENEELRKQFSQKMVIGAEKFQLEPIIQKWERILDEI